MPLCHWSSQLFDLRTLSSTDVPVLLLNQPINLLETMSCPNLILTHSSRSQYLRKKSRTSENQASLALNCLECEFLGIFSGPQFVSEQRRQADLATERERHLTTGKRAERTKLDFRSPIGHSAIGQASCLICARCRQPTFPFCC